MQESANKSKTEDIIRSVWTVVHPTDSHYVPRCSFCGKFRKELRMHWFFTGLYCRNCIQEVLWNDVRNFKEMQK